MISILVLLPWEAATRHMTMRSRQQIYAAAMGLLGLLQRQVAERRSETRLTPQLLERLGRAAMLCPGFTPLMKDNVAALLAGGGANNDDGDGARDACARFNQPHLAHLWSHQYGMAVRPGAPLDVLEVSFSLSFFPLPPPSATGLLPPPRFPAPGSFVLVYFSSSSTTYRTTLPA